MWSIKHRERERRNYSVLGPSLICVPAAVIWQISGSGSTKHQKHDMAPAPKVYGKCPGSKRGNCAVVSDDVR